jgi:hypothetical protein
MENTTAAPSATKERRRSPLSLSSYSADEELLLALRLLDPLVQFFPKAAGHATVPLVALKATLPLGVEQHPNLLSKLQELSRHGILQLTPSNDNAKMLRIPPTPTYIGTTRTR